MVFLATLFYFPFHAGERWHRRTHRVRRDRQHRCKLRTATEEWLLASQWHAHDVTNAEFIRTYMSADFLGGRLVQRLEREVRSAPPEESRKVAQL